MTNALFIFYETNGTTVQPKLALLFTTASPLETPRKPSKPVEPQATEGQQFTVDSRFADGYIPNISA
jgi:hypothetical protein